MHSLCKLGPLYRASFCIVLHFLLHYNYTTLIADGCEMETTGEYEWTETDLGDYASTECPCFQFLDSLAGSSLRFCGGDYTNGARWNDEADTSMCVALTSSITERLCLAASVSIIHNASYNVATLIQHRKPPTTIVLAHLSVHAVN